MPQMQPAYSAVALPVRPLHRRASVEGQIRLWRRQTAGIARDAGQAAVSPPQADAPVAHNGTNRVAREPASAYKALAKPRSNPVGV